MAPEMRVQALLGLTHKTTYAQLVFKLGCQMQPHMKVGNSTQVNGASQSHYPQGLLGFSLLLPEILHCTATYN